MDKLLIKRGSKRALEQLDPLQVGELFLAKDEERLYVGGPRGNIPIPTQKDLDEKATKTELQQVSLAYKESYDTLDDLKKAYPNGDVYNHVVLADGMIYTYAKGEWISTGVVANGVLEFMKAYEDLKVLGVGGRNLIKDSNNFTNYAKFSGATVTFTTDVSVSEWNATDATRIQTSGGTLTVKLHKDIVAPSVAGQQYTVSVWVKNIGNYPVVVRTQLSGISTVNVGEQKRVIITVTGDGTSNLQLRFETTGDNISNPLDFIVWRAKAELGNKATDWTPAPEDINAHPFVVELAESVYRSKQNEERIRNLENAITALGGGS